MPRSLSRLLARLGLVGVLAAALYLLAYRPLQLRWGATPAEVARAMPGDGIQPHPIFDATRAVTIEAPPGRIWPWLAQIGFRRAGWYSNLDWLDNDGIPSAARIRTDLQRLQPGDALPIWRNLDFRVVESRPGEYLLVSSESGRDSWFWALVPAGPGRTRLLWRMRHAAYAWRSPGYLAVQLATDLGDFVVVRNILLGIKERVEGRPIGSLAAGTPEVMLWLAAFLAFLGTLVAAVVRRDWLRPLLAIGLAAATTLGLVFWMPPPWVDAVGVLGLYGGLWFLGRQGRSPLRQAGRNATPG